MGEFICLKTFSPFLGSDGQAFCTKSVSYDVLQDICSYHSLLCLLILLLLLNILYLPGEEKKIHCTIPLMSDMNRNHKSFGRSVKIQHYTLALFSFYLKTRAVSSSGYSLKGYYTYTYLCTHIQSFLFLLLVKLQCLEKKISSRIHT